MQTKDKQKDNSDLGGSGAGSYNIAGISGAEMLRLLFWIALVVAVGMLAVNQSLGFFYKAHLLKQPCQLCGELNPGVQACIDNLNAPRPSYWTQGGWTDPFNETSNFKIEK